MCFSVLYGTFGRVQLSVLCKMDWSYLGGFVRWYKGELVGAWSQLGGPWSQLGGPWSLLRGPESQLGGPWR